MKKTLSLVLYVCLALPVSLAALFLVSAKSSFLDRGFYKRLVTDERVFTIASDPALIARVPETATLGQVKLAGRVAYKAALETIPRDAYRSEAAALVDGLFDAVERPGSPGYETKNLKGLVAATLPAFSLAYAKALPVEARAFDVSANPADFTFRPETAQVETYASLVYRELAKGTAALPDRIEIRKSDLAAFDEDFAGTFKIRDAVENATLVLSAAALALVVSCAFIRTGDWGRRLSAFGAYAIVPGVSVFVIGVLLFVVRGALTRLAPGTDLAGIAPETITALSGFVRDNIAVAVRPFMVTGGVVLAVGAVAVGVGRGMVAGSAEE